MKTQTPNIPQRLIVQVLPGHEASLTAQIADGRTTSTKPKKHARRRTLVVEGPWLCLPETCERLAQILLAANADPAVAQIILLWSSPGGLASGVPELFSVIGRVNSSTPVHVVATDVLASAAYHAAAAATSIFATTSTQVGSIGTRALLVDTSEFWRLQGITLHHVATSEKKLVGADGRAVSDDDRKAVQVQVEQSHILFTRALLSSGRLTQKQLDVVNDARVVLAGGAKSLGMIDGVVDTVDDRIAELVEADQGDPHGELKGNAAREMFLECANRRFVDIDFPADLSDEQMAKMAEKFPSLTAEVERQVAAYKASRECRMP
ncbi:S49 family peptidase [Pirellulales bacterium]|nr:S49 family peptidase [Pirellulales bacterium]